METRTGRLQWRGVIVKLEVGEESMNGNCHTVITCRRWHRDLLSFLLEQMNELRTVNMISRQGDRAGQIRIYFPAPVNPKAGTASNLVIGQINYEVSLETF